MFDKKVYYKTLTPKITKKRYVKSLYLKLDQNICIKTLYVTFSKWIGSQITDKIRYYTQ